MRAGFFWGRFACGRLSLLGDSSIYIALAVWLIAIVFLSFGIKALWSRFAKGKGLKLFLYPGTVVHELSHAFLCLITGATITEFNLLRLEDVEIKYDRPKVPVFGDFLIVLAPIVVCAMILMLISALLGDPINVKTALPKDIEFTAKGFFQFAKDLIDAIKVTLFGLWKEANFRDGRWIGFIIATIIFTVSMAPQKGDLKYLVPGIIIIAAIPFFLGKFGILLNLWVTKKLEHFWVIINLAGCMLLCILFLSSISLGIYQAVRLTLSKKRPGE